MLTILPFPQGAYAEYIVAPRGNLIKKPAHLSWAEAASIPEVMLTGTLLLASTRWYGHDKMLLASAPRPGDVSASE